MRISDWSSDVCSSDLIHQLNPDNLAYNFQSTIRFQGPLDFAALQAALGEILRRHEGYRSTYPMVDGRPQQVVHPAEPYLLMLVDFSVQPEARRDGAVKAWCDELFQKRFDLERLPMVMWTLLRLGAEDHVLVRSEEHTSELQSLMRISYAVFCLK